MRKILLVFCMMTAIAASAQNEEEEWIPDSIEMDPATFMAITLASEEPDTIGCHSIEEEPDIVEVEWDDRFAVAEKDGKWGLYDVKGDSLLTDLIYDEAGPAFRKRVFDEYITYYYIRQGDRAGVVGVFESTGGITTILASQKDKAVKKEEDE